jgi:hypothetical protein
MIDRVIDAQISRVERFINLSQDLAMKSSTCRSVPRSAHKTLAVISNGEET